MAANRVAQVNAALKQRGEAERLRAGRGYYYFDGGDAAGWPATAVYVYRASALTVREWLAEYDSLRAAGAQVQVAEHLLLEATTRERLVYAAAQTYGSVAPDVWGDDAPDGDEAVDVVLDHIEMHGGLCRADRDLLASLPYAVRARLVKEAL